LQNILKIRRIKNLVPTVAKKRGRYRFSDHFKLNKSQNQLDFVDIPLDTDISLYVDPYALSVSGNDWLRECGNIVVSFFDYFLAVIRKNDESKSMQVIANLHEPNDTHLGLSKGRPSGRGWGGKQGRMLYDRLRTSAAVKSGKVKDLSEIELFIPGIASDKISDLTVNVLRGEFVAYTEEQCQLLNIPTQQISSGLYWNYESTCWESRYANLPIYKGERIVLVPKLGVRVRLIPDHEEFYNKFVLDFLAAEHLNANDSLVTLLKKGTSRVYRKDLKNKYKLSKEFLYEFTIEHPKVLQTYKESMRDKGTPIKDGDIEERQRVPRPTVLSDKNVLNNIPAGQQAANDYHDFILGALTEIFYPWLTHPIKEQPIDNGRKRIDILYNNSSESGFFSRLVQMHKIHCPYVSVECKNYSEDPANPELDQLQGRFSRKRGRFGILVCRKIDDPEKLLKRLQDVVNNTEGVIVVLDDSDIANLLEFKSKDQTEEIDAYLELKLKPVLM
jgi:hypothetical protein